VYWQSLSDFLAMGGYGFYVWMSFGITAAVLLIETVALRINARVVRERAESE
jgi:heme exporter protein D